MRTDNLGRAFCSVALASVMLSGITCIPQQARAEGPQFDAPYYDLREKNTDKWATEDKQIDAKLAALQERFGKRPNIIYILADDIGWGELGWQGGGKHRGTPTSELDQMAYEGMRFYAAYSEPSCTPSRIASIPADTRYVLV